jgi:hypothetical protein
VKFPGQFLSHAAGWRVSFIIPFDHTEALIPEFFSPANQITSQHAQKPQG